MAQRRMFSKTITNSGKFLKMPATSRLLYYDLGMNADDDGYAEWFTVLRMNGAGQQDLGVLEANGFVQVFDENVLVILDWKEHNYIPKDRYTPSKYALLYNGIQPVYKVETQVRLGKDRILGGETPQIVKVEDEERPKKESRAKYPHSKEVFGWFPKPQPSWMINTTELKHAELLYSRGESAVRGILKFVAKHKDDEFFPKVVKPSDLERKWEDIAAFKV